MKTKLRSIAVLLLLMLPFGHALADAYEETIKLYRDANESRTFFNKSYGYAVFPFIGKGGYFIGGAFGNGRVYRGGSYVGDSAMGQISVGFQLGGQGYSQIVFFEDKRAFDEFTKGDFDMGVQANVVAITAGASAQAGTGGATASASGTQYHAANFAKYHNGMAVFKIVKGGLMYEASVGAQFFDYSPQGERFARRATSPQDTTWWQ